MFEHNTNVTGLLVECLVQLLFVTPAITGTTLPCILTELLGFIRCADAYIYMHCLEAPMDLVGLALTFRMIMVTVSREILLVSTAI